MLAKPGSEAARNAGNISSSETPQPPGPPNLATAGLEEGSALPPWMFTPSAEEPTAANPQGTSLPLCFQPPPSWSNQASRNASAAWHQGDCDPRAVLRFRSPVHYGPETGVKQKGRVQLPGSCGKSVNAKTKAWRAAPSNKGLGPGGDKMRQLTRRPWLRDRILEASRAASARHLQAPHRKAAKQPSSAAPRSSRRLSCSVYIAGMLTSPVVSKELSWRSWV